MITMDKCIFRTPPNIGFFAFYNIVLVLIDYCIKNGHVPGIDYTTFVYKATRSEDPWHHFFEPLELYSDPYEIKGEIELMFNGIAPLKCSSDPSYIPVFGIWTKFDEDLETRLLVNKLCDHIKIKQKFLDQAEEFKEKHFSGKKVVGIHIRMTDHWKDDYSYVSGLDHLYDLDVYIKALREHSSDLIYIATDAQKNISKLRFYKDLRKKLIYNDFLRSPGEQSPHIYSTRYGFDPIQLGKEVIVDTLLLSKCDHLICSVSNIPYTALFWNPYLTYTNVAQMAE